MKTLLNSTELAAALERMADEIISAAPPDTPVAVVGIRRRGETLAKRLVALLARKGLSPQHQGVLDITLYRDDLTTIGPAAVVRGTEIDFDITGAWVVLVDDVLYTGRSIRAALTALTDFGRARAVRLAVLVDRGLRELPIHADFVGFRCETTPENVVNVRLTEDDGVDEVEVE